ncbi:hypothetical protein EBN88_27030 [Streptomyces triticirhizae]|uniref:Uncharacterized protein n=1 Tax=Streptomyces triticirhizae TaxID=2483353 RepID=A0A3M2L625_9ACTN|nr:hypothetical protein EBN88_27030 [Streptomyces triticirhizae]
MVPRPIGSAAPAMSAPRPRGDGPGMTDLLHPLGLLPARAGILPGRVHRAPADMGEVPPGLSPFELK